MSTEGKETIVSSDALLDVKFVALSCHEEPLYIPMPPDGPPEWWFRFGFHYMLMAAIGVAWVGCLALAIFFLSGGAR